MHWNLFIYLLIHLLPTINKSINNTSVSMRPAWVRLFDVWTPLWIRFIDKWFSCLGKRHGHLHNDVAWWNAHNLELTFGWKLWIHWEIEEIDTKKLWRMWMKMRLRYLKMQIIWVIIKFCIYLFIYLLSFSYIFFSN